MPDAVATRFPFELPDDALGHDEHMVMIRTTPNGQWSRAYGENATPCDAATAQLQLAAFLDERQDDLADARTDMVQVAVDELTATEYRIFQRTVTPFAPTH